MHDLRATARAMVAPLPAAPALCDERFRDKQPDWSHDPLTKGKVPADRFGENRFGDWTFKP